MNPFPFSWEFDCVLNPNIEKMRLLVADCMQKILGIIQPLGPYRPPDRGSHKNEADCTNRTGGALACRHLDSARTGQSITRPVGDLVKITGNRIPPVAGDLTNSFVARAFVLPALRFAPASHNRRGMEIRPL